MHKMQKNDSYRYVSTKDLLAVNAKKPQMLNPYMSRSVIKPQTSEVKLLQSIK